MTRKNGRQRCQEEATRQEKIQELLALSGIEGMEDILQLFRETIAEFSKIRSGCRDEREAWLTSGVM